MADVKQLATDLRNAGLATGDIVMLHSSLRGIGPIPGVAQDDREGYLLAILDAFDQVLDFSTGGTLVVPTFFYDYARHKEPFHYETSPADPALGIFAEFVRTRPEALRSVHPLNSLSAIGGRKEQICANLSRSSYGWNSAFDQLFKAGAKLLLMGVDFNRMTFVHHIEHMAGISHFYHKAYFTPAYKDGKELPLPFMAFVRYLNGQVDIYVDRLEKHMVDNDFVTFGNFGGADTMLVSARDVFDEGFALIQKDPCLLIKNAYYNTE